MVLQIDVVPERIAIKYKGVFDFGALYKMMRAWFEEREFDFDEGRYKHKEKDIGAEIEIDWHAYRSVTEVFQERFHIHFHMWDIREVEIVKEGKKKKVFKGRLMIEIKGIIDLDYQNQFDGSFVKEKWRNFLVDFIYRRDIDTIWGDRLWYVAHKLQQRIKLFLQMESHSDVYDDMW